MWSACIHELHQALRALTNRPAFSALVIGVLAAGLTCVIFMLVMIDGFVLRPLPFRAPDELRHVGIASDTGDHPDDLTARDLVQLRRQLEGSAEVAAFSQATVNLSDLQRPERFSGAMISANLWRVLGVAPALGRDFNADDERPGAPPVLLLSHELWQSRYGGDPAIVGRSVRVNTRSGTVVGVMPENLSYPFRETVWIPATLDEAQKPADSENYTIVARRSAQLDDAALSSALARWLADAARADPQRFRGLRMGMEPLAYYSVSRTTRAVLGIMLGAVILVLLVACANAANLLLLRTLGKRQELAVRVALGASRGRLVLHLLAQSLLLALIATLIALPLARFGVAWQSAVLRQSENGPPRWLRFELDADTVALVLVAALLTALVTGLLPAWRVGREAAAGGLRDGARGTTGGAFGRLSKVLMIGEVALSCALLIAVGTMVRGVAALDHVDVGFDTDHLLTARVGLFENAYPGGAEQLRLYEKLVERLRADADVADASVATVLPLRLSATREIMAAGAAFDGNGDSQLRYGAVDDRFLSTYGVRLLQGRFFDTRDGANGERVAVVDENFVRRYAATGDVLGRRFRLDPRDADGPTVTVVGVIAPLRLSSPGDAAQPVLLAPLRQDPARFVSLAVRVRGDAAAFAPRLAAIMREVDADTPLYWVRDFKTVIREVTFGERIIAQLFALFGVVALVLAGAGLHGVTAFSVGQRTREIGVRRALGAPPRQVLRSVFARTGWQVGAGLALGLVLGLPFSGALVDVLHRSIAPGGWPVVGATLGVLAAAALLAVLVPVRRALCVDPIEALRHE